MAKTKKIKNFIKAIFLAGGIASVIGTTAYAGYSYTGYNTTVGRFNGNGYTGYQTKSVNGANGYIKSSFVGGSYKVDVRMNSNRGSGAWVRQIGSRDNRELPGHYKQTKGSKVRLQFSNNWNTPVHVQVSGSWMSR